MKIIKRILLGLAALIVLLLIIALFVKKEYTLEREVTIIKPKQEVFDYVRMFKNQSEFNPWLRMDPATKTDIRGTDGEIGAVYAWESEKVGTGEQKTIAIANGESQFYEITFIKPFAGKAENNLYFEEVAPGETKVRNTFSSSMPYPMNLMQLCMSMDDVLGKELQNGLNNIKENLEKK